MLNGWTVLIMCMQATNIFDILASTAFVTGENYLMSYMYTFYS